MRRPEDTLIQRNNTRTVYAFGNLRFFARNGMIHIIHEDTGKYSTCSITDWTARIEMILEHAKRENYASDRTRLLRGLTAMQDCGRDAIAQGDPLKSASIEYLRRYDREHGVIVPGKGLVPCTQED
jgi:hypothetical protein